jgi:hypothetical protein
VQANDELLALADADVLAAGGETSLGRLDEVVALLLQVAPELSVAEELPEGQRGVALLVDLGHDPPLHLVELRPVVREPPTAAAVREHAVVELVGRADAARLERLGHAVRAVREHAVHAA